MIPRWQRTAYWEALPEWKRQILCDPELFILRYFGHKIDALQDFHRALVHASLTEPRSLILFPANHGKTTLISTVLPVLEMCRNPDIIMTGILKNEVDSNGIGQAILAELLSNTELIRDFGPFQPVDTDKPFALGRMSIDKRTIRRKEPTLALFGAGSRSALGHRSDWTFCDDIIHDRNSSTPEQRAKVKEWFMQGPATQGDGMDSRLTVVGTRFDPEDLYGDLLEMANPESGAPIYTSLEFDAIQNEETQETLWPERWPWLRLMILKAEMGTLDFNKRLRNIAVDKSRMVFREEYLKGGYMPGSKEPLPGCLDRSYKVGDFEPSWRRYGGFDPAVGLTRSAKFCVHVALGVGSCKDHERCFWVIDCARDQMTLPQQVNTVLESHERYSLELSKVEANSYQGGLFQAIEQKMKDRGVAYRVEPHYTTRTNKPDPEIGVAAMAPYFERGMVHIPWGDQYSQRRMRQLVDELIMFPGKYTDTVMALWFAWIAAQEEAPKFRSFNRLERKGSLYGRVGGRRKVLNPYYDRSEAVGG